jgi:hypothetical protein
MASAPARRAAHGLPVSVPHLPLCSRPLRPIGLLSFLCSQAACARDSDGGTGAPAAGAGDTGRALARQLATTLVLQLHCEPGPTGAVVAAYGAGVVSTSPPTPGKDSRETHKTSGGPVEGKGWSRWRRTDSSVRDEVSLRVARRRRGAGAGATAVWHHSHGSAGFAPARCPPV